MFTPISLCSQALLSLGANTISAFDEGTVEAEVCANLYPLIRDALLSSHPWSFATGQVTLARLSATPIADYQYAYQLPTDFLRVLSAGENAGRGMVYRLHEGRLHSNAESVVLTYIFRPDEGAFPPYFVATLVKRLSAEFALPITESASRAEVLHKLAAAELSRAKTIDSQQMTPASLDNFPLVDCRG